MCPFKYLLVSTGTHVTSANQEMEWFQHSRKFLHVPLKSIFPDLQAQANYVPLKIFSLF